MRFRALSKIFYGNHKNFIYVILKDIFEIFRKKKKTPWFTSTKKIISYIFENKNKPEEHKVKWLE